MHNLFIDNNARKAIKNKAFEEPKGVLAKTLLCVLVIWSLLFYLFAYTFMGLGYNFSNNLPLLLASIFVTPLIINYINLFLLNNRDEIFVFSDLFKQPLRALKGAILLIILLLIYLVFIFIVMRIPFIGYFLNLIITIIFLPLFIFIPMVYLENDKANIKKIIVNTFALLKGHYLELYGLLFSFIPWFILGAFTFGLLYFWLVPYVMISFTYLYTNLKKEEFKKNQNLSNLGVVIITILCFCVFLIISFINIPENFKGFVNTIFNYNVIQSKGQYQLTYSNTPVATFDVPKGYKESYRTNSTISFINTNGDIVLYTAYLSAPDKALTLDKNNVNKLEEENEVTDETFTLKIDDKTLQGYQYTIKDKEKDIIVYYPKGSITIAVTLSTKDLSVTKEDIKKFIKIY